MATYNLDYVKQQTKLQNQHTPQVPEAPQAYTPPAANQNAAQRGVGIEQYVNDWRNNFGVQLKQSEGAGWDRLLNDLHTEGYTGTTLDTRNDGMHKGIYLNGDPNQFVRLANGYDQPVWEPGGGGASGGGGGTVFSDPATQGWETLIRQMAGQLGVPQQAQHYQGLVDYLSKYMQQLQGPAYTPQQSDLIQTQALDPMTQTRDAQKQQVLQWASSHGLDPKSGPVLQQMADIDKGYSQARTQTQAGFANQAIGLEKQQQATAAQVGSMLQSLEQGQLSNNEGRQLQATSLMGQIPALADSRLQMANQTLGAGGQGLNGLLQFLLSANGQQNQQQQFNAQQSQQYWAQIGALLGNIFT